MINWLIVSLAVAALLFALYFVRCARKILAVNSEIDRTLNDLTADKAENMFAKSELLLPAWKDFDSSLTSDRKFSTVSASEFFHRRI